MNNYDMFTAKIANAFEERISQPEVQTLSPGQAWVAENQEMLREAYLSGLTLHEIAQIIDKASNGVMKKGTFYQIMRGAPEIWSEG